MSMEYVKSIIIENVKIENEIFSMKLRHKDGVRAGQFYMLKTENAFLGRPISVCEVEGDIIRFVYAIAGSGTKELKSLRGGESLKVIGPLGNGFDTQKDYKKVALVSGGIGTAPMLELAKQLKSKKMEKLDLYAGFRDDIYLVDEINNFVDDIYVSTNTGKYGHKGFVTDKLIENIKSYDTVLCCGPEIMMKKVVEICQENNVEVYISMEKHMACGVGACLVCTCKTKRGNKRVCKDGPVFNGFDVEF